MNREQARNLIKTTFTRAFDKSSFRTFTLNVLNRIDESKEQAWNTQYVKDAFKPHVQRYERLGTYTSPDKEKLDVLIVHLTNESKLERARTAIRNFVADHLKTRDEKEAALVAFVSPAEKQWRFSYVKMDYATVEKESGKVGVETRLTPARRFSYLVGESESSHTAQSRFVDLLQDTQTDPSLADIEEAFSVEAVTKEFFTKYAELFEQINKALTKLVDKDTTVRDEFKTKQINTVDFAKKLMGQIVFLYFLQKKGWLGVGKGNEWGTGPRDFLRRLTNGEYSKYDNFFNDVLEPLFYDTLATDRGHEAWDKRFKCRIPFLNGGLFEPLGDYDWRKTDIILPNKLFTNNEFIEEGITGTGVLDVFDRYNFTVNEAQPLEIEVAIDPEMLGKVFENLIEENRRKGLGAYYTPREIVHYMCQQSLINYLDTAINKENELVTRADLETFVHLGEQYSFYETAKQSGTIGRDYPEPPKSIRSHARLIDDKLREITVCDPAVGSGAFPVGIMTEIVRARMALTPYFNDPHERAPYHFKRHAIQQCLYGVDIDPGAVEIAKLRLWLSLVVDEEQTRQIKPLPNLDYKVVVGNSLVGFPYRSERISEIESLKKELFDETDHYKKAMIKLEIERRIQEAFAGSRKSLGFRVSFDFQLQFSEVFHGENGFDVIIGNPPYISYYSRQAKEISPEALRYYQASYRFLRSNPKKKSINTVMLFLEKGRKLLTNGGALSYIIDVGFLEKVYKEIRGYISEIDVHELVVDISAFENVASGQIVFLARNRKITPQQFSCAVKSDFKPVHNALTRTQFTTETVNLSQEHRILNGNLSKLSDLADVTCGLEYGALRDRFLSPRKLNSKYHKAIFGGKNIPSKYTLLWHAEDGYVLFDKHFEAELVKRKQNYSETGKYVHFISGDEAKYLEPKLLVRQSAMEIIAAYDEEKLYAMRSLFLINAKDKNVCLKYLLAILNSRFISYYALKNGIIRCAKGKQPQIRVSGLQSVPVPIADSDVQERIISLVEKIIEKKSKLQHPHTTELEREIDQLVYKLYGLTEEEIKIVEDSTR